jgi:hypothetical protein
MRGLLISLLFLAGCCTTIPKSVRESYKHELYIDYKYVSFQGRNSQQSLYFAIDSTNGMWYHGRLVINETDTISMQGFAKGNHYVTTIPNEGNGTSDMISIWTNGQQAEIIKSLRIYERGEQKKYVKEETILYRMPR